MDARQVSRKATLLVVSVFVLGILLGAVGTYIAGSRVWGAAPWGKSAHGRAHLVERLTQELTLSPDQQGKLDAILADTQAKYKVLYEPLRPQAEQIRQQGRDQIRAILTPEQRPKFEDFLRRLDEERAKRNGK